MKKMKKLMESFMNDEESGLTNYFEKQREKNLGNREDYKILKNEKNRIMDKYPNVRKFLEKGEIIELSDEEKDSILTVRDIEEEMSDLEHKDTFKLGFKEAYIYFEEMGMLNI